MFSIRVDPLGGRPALHNRPNPTVKAKSCLHVKARNFTVKARTLVVQARKVMAKARNCLKRQGILL